MKIYVGYQRQDELLAMQKACSDLVSCNVLSHSAMKAVPYVGGTQPINWGPIHDAARLRAQDGKGIGYDYSVGIADGPVRLNDTWRYSACVVVLSRQGTSSEGWLSPIEIPRILVDWLDSRQIQSLDEALGANQRVGTDTYRHFSNGFCSLEEGLVLPIRYALGCQLQPQDTRLKHLALRSLTQAAE